MRAQTAGSGKPSEGCRIRTADPSAAKHHAGGSGDWHGPLAGTKKAKGTQMVLLVSTGPLTGCDPRIVTDVMGKTEEVAKARLECVVQG